jgi:hypothetical protein
MAQKAQFRLTDLGHWRRSADEFALSATMSVNGRLAVTAKFGPPTRAGDDFPDKLIFG